MSRQLRRRLSRGHSETGAEGGKEKSPQQSLASLFPENKRLADALRLNECAAEALRMIAQVERQ